MPTCNFTSEIVSGEKSKSPKRMTFWPQPFHEVTMAATNSPTATPTPPAATVQKRLFYFYLYLYSESAIHTPYAPWSWYIYLHVPKKINQEL